MPSLIALDREGVEVLRVVGFALEGVAEVGVVRHEDHHVAVLVEDRAGVQASALSAPRSDVPPPMPRHSPIDGIWMTRLTSNCWWNIGWRERHVDDRVFRGRQRLADLARPHVPRPGAPEVVGPQEAALQQVLAQALGFLRTEVGVARPPSS